MSGALAPIRKAAGKIAGKVNTFNRKAFGEDFANVASKVSYSALPLLVGSDSKMGRGYQTAADPLNIFGAQDEFAQSDADTEAARILATQPGPKPLPDIEEITRARKQNLARQRSRRGRASTIMSDSYGNDALGG